LTNPIKDGLRIALLADIHGNPIALDVVLADIESRGGVDGYWILGDLCAIGFDPAGVIEQLAALPNIICVRGNADRYVTTEDRPPPTPDEARADPALLPLFAEVAGSFAWTRGYLEGRGWLDWLAALPLEQRVTLPDGTRVLLVHASPGTDENPGLHPALTDEEFSTLIAGGNADLICVGHFHLPMDRRLNGVRAINPGSVSNNFPMDQRAAYAILTTDQTAYNIQYYRVDYDRQAAIEATKRSGNPGAGYVLRFFEGKVRAGWMDKWDGVSHGVKTHL
jgi:putative phosphoesterase